MLRRSHEGEAVARHSEPSQAGFLEAHDLLDALHEAHVQLQIMEALLFDDVKALPKQNSRPKINTDHSQLSREIHTMTITLYAHINMYTVSLPQGLPQA